MTHLCHAALFLLQLNFLDLSLLTLIYKNTTSGKWLYVECQTSCITLTTTLFMKHIELKTSKSHSKFVTASIKSKLARKGKKNRVQL